LNYLENAAPLPHDGYAIAIGTLVNPSETISHGGPDLCGLRRLPVYFVVDFSAAAQPGFATAAAQQVREIIARLETLAATDARDFQSAPVFYTVLVFRRTALQFHPLAPPGRYPFGDLRLAEIEPCGEPGLAAAIAAVEDSIENELKMPGADNGDDLPMIFLFTDRPLSDKLKRPVGAKIIVCGVEPPPKISPAKLALEFSPLACQSHVFGKIEAAHSELKKGRQQMIDYPTVY
jgi:hypothetical protein